MATERPEAFDLWRQADREHPGDDDGRRRRYHALMVEHGLLVPKDDPRAGPKNLPCGWPGGRRGA